MITHSHRQKLTESKYAQRLVKRPWRVRCLPQTPDQMDRWLPFPAASTHEITAALEAALQESSLELADYAVCYPRLVSLEHRDSLIFLTPRSLSGPPLVWLRWYSKTSTTTLLLNPVEQTYYQTQASTLVTVEAPSHTPTDYRIPPQYLRWVAWMTQHHADILDQLAKTRP